MKVLFDTSMLYIDNPVKRGIYYFTLNLLKYLKKQSGLRVIEYPIALHTGLNSIIRMPYDITKLLIYKNVNLIFIPHGRTFTHALSLHVVPRPINIVIHDVFFLVLHSPASYKLTMLSRYLLIRDAVMTRDDVIVTTVSMFSKWAITHYLDIDPSRVFVIYPGIDEIFKPVDKEIASRFVREKYGIEGRYFIYSGAISTHKGVRDLIRAFLLFNKDRNYILVLTGPPGDPELLRLIRSTDSIKYLGHVPRADMPMLFSAATAFVFPSYHEGFGLPPLEAAACGTPVIVSRIPVFLETLGDAGVFVKPGDIDGLASAMSMLADNEDLRIKLGLKALNRARMFTWWNTVKEYVRLWRQMIERR
jgi:glycosyltransferase involved in cell wall biosynthesis